MVWYRVVRRAFVVIVVGDVDLSLFLRVIRAHLILLRRIGWEALNREYGFLKAVL